MKRHNYAIAVLTALGAFGACRVAAASSHREAPFTSYDPQVDNTDVWAWVTPGTHDSLNVIMSYIPLEEPSSGPNYYKFSDEVLYALHIARGTQSLEDAVTYQIKFQTSPTPYVNPADLSLPVGGGKEFFAQLTNYFAQTYSITKIEGSSVTVIARDVPVAPPNIGPRTNQLVYKINDYDDAFARTFVRDMSSEGRIWAGQRDDGFYINTGGVFDLGNLQPVGVAKDNLAGFNVHTIAMQIPTNMLTVGHKPCTAGSSDDQLLGVWASASRHKVRVLRRDGTNLDYGPWTQVSRLGLPLVNEVIIGLQDKERYNRTQPATDAANFGAYFLNPVLVRDADALGVYAALGVPRSTVSELEQNRTDILDAINLRSLGFNIPLSATGDVLRVDLGTDSLFPNGRQIPGAAPNKEQVNVTDALLTLVLTKNTIPISAGVTVNDRDYLTSFPYLALPWQGFSQGHGTPSPR